MSFNAIREKKIIAKISESTVWYQEEETRTLTSQDTYFYTQAYNKKGFLRTGEKVFASGEQGNKCKDWSGTW